MKANIFKLLPAIATFIMMPVLITGCITVSVPPGQTQEQSKPAVTESAIFTFAPIQVSPQSLVAGKPITVTMKITNSGTAAGTYKADLYIDGVIITSQNIAINPGISADATFQTALQTAGHHIIGIGQQTLDVTASENWLPVTIKIDNGQMDGCSPVAEGTSLVSQMAVQNNGNMIKLAAPQGGFTISGVNIAGYIKDSTYDFNHDPVIGGSTWVYGADIAVTEPVRQDFTVNIYGDRRNKLYSGSFQKSLFSNIPSAVTVPMPNINVSGDFYIEVLTLNLPKLSTVGGWDHDYWNRYVVHTWYHQLCIGYENSNDPQSWISDGGTAVPGFYPTYNWMIRAEGYQSRN